MTDTSQAIAAVPQVTVSGLLIFGQPLDTWVLVLTAIYTALLLFALVRDKYLRYYFKKGEPDVDTR